MKFDRAKNAVKTCLALCIVLCLMSIITASVNPNLSFIATVISGICFILSFVIAYLYCTCPYCGKHIMLGMFKAKRCPKCQRDLATGAKPGKVNKKKH